MRLLVTGGAGFIGQAVVADALAAGWQVRVLDSLRADVHGAPPEPTPDVEWMPGDVRDAATVTEALQDVDAVSHQAAKVGLGVDFADAPDYVSSNDLGTATLLAAMAATGTTRLVLASSMVVYGECRYRGSDSAARRPASPRGTARRRGGAARSRPISLRRGQEIGERLRGTSKACCHTRPLPDCPRTRCSSTGSEQSTRAL